MSHTAMNGPQSPEEFQRQLAELLRQQLRVPGATPGTRTEFDTSAEPPGGEPEKKEFKFDFKPRDVKAYLDRFVIKQDEAKKVLSVALCDHYHAARHPITPSKTSSSSARPAWERPT
jgi:ATP-dependent protease Clp ATPase subunit